MNNFNLLISLIKAEKGYWVHVNLTEPFLLVWYENTLIGWVKQNENDCITICDNTKDLQLCKLLNPLYNCLGIEIVCVTSLIKNSYKYYKVDGSNLEEVIVVKNN